MSDESMTIQQWREARGLSREELAQQIGVDPERIARWEDVGGYDFHFCSTEDEILTPRIWDALQPGPEGMTVHFIPESPYPGSLVFAPRTSARVIEALKEHGLWEELLAEGLALAVEDQISICVPTPYGGALRPIEDVTHADHEAIAEWTKRDLALWNANRKAREDLLARALEHGAREDETMEEAYHRTRGFGLKPRGEASEDLEASEEEGDSS